MAAHAVGIQQRLNRRREFPFGAAGIWRLGSIHGRTEHGSDNKDWRKKAIT
jgi:hypothetical protein